MAKSTKRIMTWRFPLQRTHAGILLGNGTQGLMVWGEDKLHITVGRAGFWDHRGGTPFASKTTYKKLRALVEAGDEPAIKEIFAPASREEGMPDRPQQIGCGRLELTFPEGLRPVTGTLLLETATLTITLANAAGREEKVVIRQAISQELAWVELPESLRGAVKVETIPTWKFVGEKLAKLKVQPPETWTTEKTGGFVQRLPADPALALAWEDRGEIIVIATELGSDPVDTVKRAAAMGKVDKAARKTKTWWRQYWADVPTLDLPDPVLQRAYDYGVYKQAGMTTPGGVAASLQGPWLEEYQLPPWSCDYHFNINAQMIYWPALSTNRLEHFWPMWEMILGWLPQLKANAKSFFEVDDALMLPHAVDDRCRAVGQFWTGSIDHACTAWMGQMAWLHYRYGMEERVLREVAWPLLIGAFNGYWAMLEEVPGPNKKLSLPVSVSPEYNGSSMAAWGRDASFQLAALHSVANILPRAAAALGVPVDPRWERVQKELPPYTTVGPVAGFNLLKLIETDPEWHEADLRAQQQYARSAEGRSEETRPGPRIALWQGKDLDSSHRHPSHMGAIYPFRTVDPFAPEHRDVVLNSLYHWIRTGSGAWSGWALPFVALIHERCNHIEGAIAWLHIWDEVFTNEGHGTLHDSFFPGFTVLTAGDERGYFQHEVMQMDAGMGAITAIVELLVQCRGPLGDEIVVLPKIPRRWWDYSFDGIRVEGAFLIGATVQAGVARKVRVTSLAGGTINLTHGLGDNWTLDGEPRHGERAELAMENGQHAVLRRSNS